MTKKFGLSALLGAGALVLSSTVAMAQSGYPGSGGSSYPGSGGSSYPGSGGSSYPGSGGGSGAPGGAGGADTLGSVDTSTTTTTTYEATDAEGDALGAESGPLPNTGGEPLIASMLGTLVAGSALFLRRKLN